MQNYWIQYLRWWQIQITEIPSSHPSSHLVEENQCPAWNCGWCSSLFWVPWNQTSALPAYLSWNCGIIFFGVPAVWKGHAFHRKAASKPSSPAFLVVRTCFVRRIAGKIWLNNVIWEIGAIGQEEKNNIQQRCWVWRTSFGIILGYQRMKIWPCSYTCMRCYRSLQICDVSWKNTHKKRV